MLKIWGRKNAYNVQKVLWLLDELQIAYQHVDVGSIPGDIETPEFTTINPNQRIPVIFHNGTYIWESNTILRYLAANYDNNLLRNETPLERTHIDRWLDWELGTLQPDFLALFWNYFRTPEKKRDNAIVEENLRRCEKRFSLLNNHLSNQPYLAGDSFTIADVAVGTCLYRYKTMGTKTASYDFVNSWYQKLLARPAYQRNIATRFNELKGRQVF